MRNLKFIISAVIFLLFAVGSAMSQDFARRTVTGNIVDENGESMPGVVVSTTDGKNGVLSDEKGNFSIQLKNTDAAVNVSTIGYLTQTIDVKGKDQIKVGLVPDIQNTLNEVVVIGYGEVKKADLTGAVTNVKVNEVQ